jgi:hypothetical protein
MSNNDDPGRDKPRPADAGSPKKPYATIDLKATEVSSGKPAATTATTSTVAAGSAKPGEAGKPKDQPASSTTGTGPTASTSVPGVKPPENVATAAKTDPARTEAKSASPTSNGKPAVAGVTPQSAQPTSPPARQRGGIGTFLTHMAAGIVGGFLALLGGEQIVQNLGLPGDLLPGQLSSAQLQQRLAAVEAQSKTGAPAAAELAQKLAQKLEQSESRVARLEEQAKSFQQVTESARKLADETRALQEKAGAGGGDAVQRIAKLEDTLATLSAAAQGDQPGRLPQLAAMTARLKELESAISNQTALVRRDLTQAVETRAAQVAEAGEVAKAATQRIDRDMASVKTEQATLIQRVEVLKADGDRAAQTLRVIQQEAGALRSALDGLKGDVDSGLKSVARPNDVSAALAPVSTKIAALEQSLQGVVKSEDDRRSNAERIVLSLELANLKRVLDRGQRYEAELAEVKKAAGNRIDLAALDKFKAQGVATVVDLARDFRPVAGAILDAEAEPADGNVVDRLIAGAKSIVRVRKVDLGPGDKSAEAIVGRMETALKEGRLGAVLEEAKTLQPRSAAAAREWLEKVEARFSVDKALASIEGQLKASLGGGARTAGEPAAAGKAQN